MKAYKCEKCQEYVDGAPTGIFYDNTDPRKGVRYDLCSACVEKVLAVVNVHPVKIEHVGEEN